MFRDFLLARRGTNGPANQWLNENPLVLGLIFLVIGGPLLGTGIYGLQSGRTQDKYGNEMSGGMGQALSWVRVVGGVVCVGFALYKMLIG